MDIPKLKHHFDETVVIQEIIQFYDANSFRLLGLDIRGWETYEDWESNHQPYPKRLVLVGKDYTHTHSSTVKVSRFNFKDEDLR